MKIGQLLVTLRNMVDSFISEHSIVWEKYQREYKEKTGFHNGREFLSLQSYLGTDLLIDFAYIALAADEGVPFERELWLRSQGVQSIKNPNDEEEKKTNRVFKDIFAKIKISFNGTEFDTPKWVYDDDCVIENKFIKENKLYVKYF